MSIFGAGSNWDGVEKKASFFAHEVFEIGWPYKDAQDLYDAVSLLKAGDIIYLKANQVGSRTLRVKGIGVVTKSFVHCTLDPTIDYKSAHGFFVKMKWVVQDQFYITIPADQGKLTNVRAATFYEESLPHVQKQIIDHLFAPPAPSASITSAASTTP